MRDTLQAQIALEAWTMAIERRKPAPGPIHPSDRGIQYAAETYRSALVPPGITRSTFSGEDHTPPAPAG